MAKSLGNAVERLKQRISVRLDQDRDKPRLYRRSQKDLAKKIGIGEGTLSELLSGPSSQRGLLAHLDKIADYFGVPPSLLIHRNDTALVELTTPEYRLVAHWRNLPADVQETVMGVFDYFAGLLPEEREERRIWRMWRSLGSRDRQQLEDLLREAYRTRRIAGSRTPATPDVPASDVATVAPSPTRRR